MIDVAAALVAHVYPFVGLGLAPGRKRIPRGTLHAPAEQFFRYVTAAPSGCWEWSQSRNEYGYGLVARGVLAHRVAYAHAYGEPGGLNVCHKCDNPPCCNPRHLFLGDDSANASDRHRKGRSKNVGGAGEQHAMHKLTTAEVVKIRELHALGMVPRVIATQFGVCRAQVAKIVARKSWVHV